MQTWWRRAIRAHFVPSCSGRCSDGLTREQVSGSLGEKRRGFVPYWLRFMGEVDVDFLEAYERIYELEQGDSIDYRSSTPHRVTNAGDDVAEVLWVISPPSY